MPVERGGETYATKESYECASARSHRTEEGSEGRWNIYARSTGTTTPSAIIKANATCYGARSACGATATIYCPISTTRSSTISYCASSRRNGPK